MDFRSHISKIIRNTLLGLLFMAIVSSCLDKIDLQAPGGISEDVVVEAKLVKSNPSTISVNITRLFNFDGFSNQVTAKTVMLESDDGSSMEVRRVGDGVYRSEITDELEIDYGRGYRIKLLLQNQDLIESDYDTLQRVRKGNTLTAIKGTKLIEDDFGDIRERPNMRYILKSYLTDDKETKIHWEVIRDFKFTDLLVNRRFEIIPNKICYVTENRGLLDIRVLDPKVVNLSSDLYQQEIIEEEIDYQYAEGYNLTVVQEAITEKTYNYYNEISKVVVRTGNMFEEPAGKIRSNMTNLTNPDSEIFGMFYTADHDTIRLFISREQAGNPDTVCFRPVPPFGQSPCRFAIAECCDCLTFDVSTTQKPAFWKGE